MHTPRMTFPIFLYMEFKQYMQAFKLEDLVYKEDLEWRREPMVAEAMAN